MFGFFINLKKKCLVSLKFLHLLIFNPLASFRWMGVRLWLRVLDAASELGRLANFCSTFAFISLIYGGLAFLALFYSSLSTKIFANRLVSLIIELANMSGNNILGLFCS